MSNNIVSSGSLIRDLQTQLTASPQQPDCYKTTHRFANGMYARTFLMPANHLVIGTKQRYEHLFIILRGEVLIYTDEGGKVSMKAGDIVTSSDCAQRAVYSVTEAELLTVHRLPDPEEKDLEKIWLALVDADGMPRLYDHNNRLRNTTLTVDSASALEQK